jgi:hypothetical protein
MRAKYFVAIAMASVLCPPAIAIEHPAEVKRFLELRESCDHWRGESGYDKERQADIEWSICQSCQGTDAELARLKKKYNANPKVMEALNDLDLEIEPKDKAEARRFCKQTRKPEWQR